MNIRLIKLKYSLIAFIIALVPYLFLISIIKRFDNVTMLHINTTIFFGLLTAITNSIYIYFSITKKIKNQSFIDWFFYYLYFPFDPHVGPLLLPGAGELIWQL